MYHRKYDTRSMNHGNDRTTTGLRERRRRFVVAAHERGEDLDTIRDSVGHTNARTTRRYIPPTDSGDTRT